MILSLRPSQLLSLVLAATTLTLMTSPVYAEDPPAKTKKEIKAEKKAEKKKQDDEIIANDEHPLIINTVTDRNIGLSSDLGVRQWNKSTTEPKNISLFKSNLSADFYGSYHLTFDPKRNSLRTPGKKIYPYFSGISSTQVGGGSGVIKDSKDSQWKTTTNSSVLRLSGGAQIGDGLHSVTDNTGLLVGGAFEVDEHSGKHKDLNTGKQVTAYKDLSISGEALVGLAAFQNKDNLVSLLVPVGILYKRSQDPEFQMNRGVGIKTGIDVETTQKFTTKKNKSVVFNANFKEGADWLKDENGNKIRDNSGEFNLKVSFKPGKSPFPIYFGAGVNLNQEKIYYNGTPTSTTPNLDRSNFGANIKVGIVL